MTTLLRDLEALSDTEKEVLAERLAGDPSYWSELDEALKGGTAMRQRIESGEQHFTRDDVVLALNAIEAVRQYAHIAFSMGARNLQRTREYLSSGACAYCQWTYRDESWDWPADRDVTDADLDAVRADVAAKIREHVATCPNHPMRALEAQIAARRDDS